MKNLVFLVLGIFLLLIFAYNKDNSSYESIQNVKNVNNFSQFQTYEDIYQAVYNDEEFRTLLFKSQQIFPEQKIYLHTEDLKTNLQNIIRDKYITEISSYYSNWLKFSDKKIVIPAIIDATLNILNEGAPKDCGRDYGLFSNSSIEILDCTIIEEDLGCCASLYCEVTNCTRNAHIELAQDLGISSGELINIGAGVIAGYLITGAFNGYISLATVALVQAIAGTIHSVDWMADIFSCGWDLVFNYGEWTSPCNCECPSRPECDLITGSPMGGFVIPLDCK